MYDMIENTSKKGERNEEKKKKKRKRTGSLLISLL